MKNTLLLLIVFVITSCSTSKKPYLADSENNEVEKELPTIGIKHRLYMIGDAGGFNEQEQNYVLTAAQNRINSDESEKSLIFLGDNIYNNGLDPIKDADRSRQEKILLAQLDLASDTKAKTYFIPGNHDWNNNKAGGLEAIKRQGAFIKDNKLNNASKLYPRDGCGDPKVMRINKDLVYIFIDSQWWVHDWSEEENINSGCKIKSRREFLDKMKDIIIEHKNDKILFFLHHPMISNGKHGGHFTLRDHLFPLTKLNQHLYIPLPVLGSIYPLYRQLGGSNQDNTYELLKELHHSLEGVIRGYDVAQAIFISGHDHFLQHTMEQYIFQKSPIHYIISGSGYKEGFAAKGNNASFVHSAKGYSVLHFYKDGSTWLDFYTVSAKGKSETLQYRTQIYEAKPGKQKFNPQPNEATEKNIVAAPNPKFGKGKIFEFLMGQQYRPSWTTAIDTEIFSLSKHHGGLTPIKKGGGLFSRTLRLENKEGKEFALRSINKDFYKAVPKNLQHLEIMKLYADQNTASIPYGALYISALSKYADIYHSDPQVVYLEDTEDLGPFQPYFPKGHYLLEARPNGDWSDTSLFGGSKEIIGFNDLLYNLRKKTTHFADQKWVLKSRLFDIFIHDRDRHDDQWRWAAFKEDGRTIYRPIPRDRDWAFFKYGGVIPWIMGNVVDKKLKSFNENAIDVKSLATNANTFDRYFLNELTWPEWEAVIDTFLESMTDDAIKNSILALPKESRSYLSQEIVPKLIARKKVLKSEVKKYYDFITEEVEITGTDEKDIFDIKLLDNGDTHIIVYKKNKKHGRTEKYNRIIKSDETKEVRIYGLGGKDKFNVSVVGTNHCSIRIIGGIGHDEVHLSIPNEGDAKISIYDDPDGMTVSDLSKVADKRDAKDLQVNEYNRRGFLYDTGLPWLNLGYAPDDGLALGIGFNTIKHAWRKSPYEQSHLFNMVVTPGKRFSLDLEYEGEYPDLFRKGLGFAPSLFIETPDNINFFGLGTTDDNSNPDSNYNWVKLSSYGLNTHMIHRAASGKIRLRFGPSYESHKVDNEDDRINIVNTAPEFTPKVFERNHFIGLHSDLRIHTLNRMDKPSKGLMIRAHLKHQYELGARNHTLNLGGNFSWFVPLSYKHDIVFGSNTGYEKILGNPLFYQYPSMGNKAHLRPFRNDRYRGEAIAYQQLDLRFRLVYWNNSVLPLAIGGITGYDFGQTYFEQDDTGTIKHGWTAGLSFDLVGYFVLRTSFSGSDEGRYFKFDVGYAF